MVGETRINTDVHTADEFAAFLKENVESVCASTYSTPMNEVPFWMIPTLEHFTPLTVEDIDKLIGSTLCKNMPSWLVKEMCPLISPFVSLMLNKSLASGRFHLLWQSSHSFTRVEPNFGFGCGKSKIGHFSQIRLRPNFWPNVADTNATAVHSVRYLITNKN